MIRRPPRSTQGYSSAASDVYKRQYVDRDLDLAHQVMASDDAVDAHFAAIKSRMIARIAENPEQGEDALDILMIAKYLERIADHCTNVAEWSAFAITGVHEQGD